MTTAVALREQEMKRALMGDALRREIEMALPAHVPPARFQRVLMTSVVHDHRLAAVDPMKVVKAALKVAPLGLLTDPLLGEAYLIVDNRGEVQVRIGYRGLIKLARQSEQIAAIYAHEVYENDEIECVLGDQKRLHHRPNLFSKRGEIVGYYAVVKFTNGETDFEPMTVEQINKIREKSDGWRAFKANKIKDTPWHSAYDEMAKKTVLRRLLKRVPASPDLQEAMRHEAEIDHREYGNGDIDVPSNGITAADRRAAMQAAELVEVYDADGEMHTLQAAEVEPFLIEQKKLLASDDAAEAFAAANREHIDRSTTLALWDEERQAGGGEIPEAPEPQKGNGANGNGKSAKQRAQEIAAALRDAPNEAALKALYSRLAADVTKLPEPAQMKIAEIYDEVLNGLRQPPPDADQPGLPMEGGE